MTNLEIKDHDPQTLIENMSACAHKEFTLGKQLAEATASWEISKLDVKSKYAELLASLFAADPKMSATKAESAIPGMVEYIAVKKLEIDAMRNMEEIKAAYWAQRSYTDLVKTILSFRKSELERL